jgi:four helix bundle protein
MENAFYTAKVSCAELIAQLNIAHDIGYINEETIRDLEYKRREAKLVMCKKLSI